MVFDPLNAPVDIVKEHIQITSPPYIFSKELSRYVNNIIVLRAINKKICK